MIMPAPKKGESEEDYVSRCIPVVMEEGTAKDASQAAAMCHSMYSKMKEEDPDPEGDKKLREGRMHGVAAGHYPEIDMSEPLPRNLQPRHNRADEIDGLNEIKQP
jgi:hypothetical protein